MLVYILFGIAIALCIGADYQINKKRREEDDLLRMYHHQSRMIVPPLLPGVVPSKDGRMVRVSLAVNSSSGITSAKTGKPTRNHPWTKKEKQFLINNFKEISAKNIVKCKEMGGRHTANAIYKMADRLGLTTHNPFNNKEHNELLTEKLRAESNQE